jgi:hypothetical protein
MTKLSLVTYEKVQSFSPDFPAKLWAVKLLTWEKSTEDAGFFKEVSEFLTQLNVTKILILVSIKSC